MYALITSYGHSMYITTIQCWYSSARLHFIFICIFCLLFLPFSLLFLPIIWLFQKAIIFLCLLRSCCCHVLRISLFRMTLSYTVHLINKTSTLNTYCSNGLCPFLSIHALRSRYITGCVVVYELLLALLLLSSPSSNLNNRIGCLSICPKTTHMSVSLVID